MRSVLILTNGHDRKYTNEITDYLSYHFPELGGRIDFYEDVEPVKVPELVIAQFYLPTFESLNKAKDFADAGNDVLLLQKERTLSIKEFLRWGLKGIIYKPNEKDGFQLVTNNLLAHPAYQILEHILD